ncbi:MAG TPA: DUF418 domain-containing protein [Anaerolineae bacterium]|nr:DUF418 domain-containing protein [Anaerolineae bacterium]
MTPVQLRERVEVIDILRGFSVLGILLVNMLSFSGYATEVQGLGTADRIAVLLIKFVAQAKFYTLFSFLFGWGIAVQMARAAQRGTRFVPLYVRRLLILLLIGLVHAVFIWSGDILVTYALLGLLLLLFRTRSDRTLLVAVIICMLVPILISTPGPGETFREAYARATENLRQDMLAGHRAGVYAGGNYLEVTLHRLKELRHTYATSIYWATHVFGMFLIGLYAGRRGIFSNIPAHLPLFRKVMWWGLILGVVFNLAFVAVTASPTLVPPSLYDLATRGARTIGGPALCLFYVSGIVLLVQQDGSRTGVRWRKHLSPLASVGRMALSNYLFQSLVCTLVFYGYGLGLYRRLGPAITLVLTFVTYRIQIGLSGWWLRRYRFGPVEWLWRSLTYGKLQSLAPERSRSSRVGSIVTYNADQARTSDAPPRSPPEERAISGWLVFMVRRLLFIAVVAFAIVYFCALGLRLSVNSTSTGRTLGAWEVAGPALEDTIDFFKDGLRGDLGYTVRGISQRTRVPVADMLADTYGESARLLLVSITLATAGGIAAGGLAAARRHSPLALSTLTLTVIGVSIPSFFLALLFRVAAIAFYQRTGIRLVSIFGPSLSRTQSLLPQMTLPALVLAARPLAHITRVTFVSISEILRRDFIRTARAKGLRPSVVFWRHALRNAGISILTAVVISLRFALGSLPVVEIFFEWPGVGFAMLNAIYRHEVKAVAVLGLSLGVSFLLINLLLDVIYRWIDPRLQAGGNGGEA